MDSTPSKQNTSGSNNRSNQQKEQNKEQSSDGDAEKPKRPNLDTMQAETDARHQTFRAIMATYIKAQADSGHTLASKIPDERCSQHPQQTTSDQQYFTRLEQQVANRIAVHLHLHLTQQQFRPTTEQRKRRRQEAQQTSTNKQAHQQSRMRSARSTNKSSSERNRNRHHNQRASTSDHQRPNMQQRRQQQIIARLPRRARASLMLADSAANLASTFRSRHLPTGRVDRYFYGWMQQLYAYIKHHQHSW